MQNTVIVDKQSPSEPAEPPSRPHATQPQPSRTALAPLEGPAKRSQAKSSWLANLPFLSKKNQPDALKELLVDQSDNNQLRDGITQQERLLLSNIHALRSRTVGDIKIPRADIIFVDMNANLDQLLELIREHGHSRMPVVDRDLDEVKGMLHVKDLLLRSHMSASSLSQVQDKDLNWHSYLRNILFVVPNLPVMDLLKEMRDKKIHMALVVDEYGGIDGLVTIEDLVEQIIGDIADEHDAEDEPMIRSINAHTFEIDARFEIEDFERLFGAILSDEEREDDIDTLGGLVSWLKGEIPTRGEIITHQASGLKFSVLQADLRRVKLLRVSHLQIKDPQLLRELTDHKSH